MAYCDVLTQFHTSLVAVASRHLLFAAMLSRILFMLGVDEVGRRKAT
jgi:hypothetical protein